MSEGKQLLKASEVAKHFGLHCTSLNNWRKAGCPTVPNAFTWKGAPVFGYDLDAVIAWGLENNRLERNADGDVVVKKRQPKKKPHQTVTPVADMAASDGFTLPTKPAEPTKEPVFCPGTALVEMALRHLLAAFYAWHVKDASVADDDEIQNAETLDEVISKVAGGVNFTDSLETGSRWTIIEQVLPIFQTAGAAQEPEWGGVPERRAHLDQIESLESDRLVLAILVSDLDDRIHSGYDWNTDPDNMTLRVSQALNGDLARYVSTSADVARLEKALRESEGELKKAHARIDELKRAVQSHTQHVAELQAQLAAARSPVVVDMAKPGTERSVTVHVHLHEGGAS